MGCSDFQFRLSLLGPPSQPPNPAIANRKIYGRYASDLERTRYCTRWSEELCRNASIEIPPGHGRGRSQSVQ
jgi:hypothetical protein